MIPSAILFIVAGAFLIIGGDLESLKPSGSDLVAGFKAATGVMMIGMAVIFIGLNSIRAAIKANRVAAPVAA